jgi:dipicolinate synthase subunit A
VRWEGLEIAVIGGDEREREISRLAAATGATVRAYGFPWPEGGIDGVTQEASALAAAKGARYVLFPIPLGVGDLLYAPHAPEPIRVDDELLGRMSPDAHIFLGRATAAVREVAERAGVFLHEYDDDVELMLLRGPAIVEGAISAAIEHTEVTIHAATVGVVGFGTIGTLLVRTLVALGADVHVFARNPVQRAGAYAAGATPHALHELTTEAAGLDMLFSTVPAKIVDRSVLGHLRPGSLVLDIAPPPEHADLDAATELGHVAVWARGLGKRAPITVGRSQWMGLRWRIEALEARLGATG